MFLFCYNKKRRPTVSLKQAVESATQVVVSDNLSVNDKLLGLFAAVQIGKLAGGRSYAGLSASPSKLSFP